MKRLVKKCECGRVTNPIQLSIVEDAWYKDDMDYFQFKCPQCEKVHVLSAPHNTVLQLKQK